MLYGQTKSSSSSVLNKFNSSILEFPKHQKRAAWYTWHRMRDTSLYYETKVKVWNENRSKRGFCTAITNWWLLMNGNFQYQGFSLNSFLFCRNFTFERRGIYELLPTRVHLLLEFGKFREKNQDISGKCFRNISNFLEQITFKHFNFNFNFFSSIWTTRFACFNLLAAWFWMSESQLLCIAHAYLERRGVLRTRWH